MRPSDGGDTIDLGWSAEPLAEGATLLRGHLREHAEALLAHIAELAAAAPFRHMTVPGGDRMSAATTSCGALGWITDLRGYRYGPDDPLTGRPWPAMPELFASLAHAAAAGAGFAGFQPDSCLINRYQPGARMTVHRDDSERAHDQPIVSFSLGLPVHFRFGGLARSDPLRRILLTHGDVVVWGGPARLRYHAVLPLKDGVHPLAGRCRLNLTFRRAG